MVEKGIIVALLAAVILGALGNAGCAVKKPFTVIAHALQPRAVSAAAVEVCK